MSEVSESVSVRWTDGAVQFVSGTSTVDVSAQIAARCGLLEDVKDQPNEDGQIRIPVSLDAISAWLEFAKQEEGELTKPGCGAQGNDEAAVRALQVPLTPSIAIRTI